MFKDAKLYIGIISRDFFQICLVTYLILILLENFKSGFVSFFFNLNVLLGMTVAAGILMALTYQEEASSKVSSALIGKKVWHYFFTSMKGRWGRDSKWQFLFKEVRAKQLIESNLHYSTNDWLAYLKELESKQLAQTNLSFLLREISLRRILDRDWRYFSRQVDLQKHLTQNEFYYLLLVSFGGGLLVFYKTESMGGLSLLLVGFIILIIALLSYLIFNEDN